MIIVLFIILIEFILKPRLDFQDSEYVFLWYGSKSKRKYFRYDRDTGTEED